MHKVNKKILFLVLILSMLFSSQASEEIKLQEIKLENEQLLRQGWKIYQPFHHMPITENDFMENAKQGLRTGKYHIIYAFKSNEVVGLISYANCYDLYWGHYFHIDSFIVGENYRSQGIGKKLMDYVKNQGENVAGLKGIFLESASDNKPGHEFYKREKFESWGIAFSFDFSAKF